LKEAISKEVNNFAPEQPIKLKQKDFFPWEDNELYEKRKIRDYLHSRYKETDSLIDNENFELFQKARSEYQSLNRKKMCEYFANKSIHDFKNSKKFWQFYSSSIRLKSDDSNENLIPPSLISNNAETSDINNYGDTFNIFFTSISSNSNFKKEQSKIEIAERLMCAHARVDSHKLRKGALSADEMNLLVQGTYFLDLYHK
jgi:hypothetical protein